MATTILNAWGTDRVIAGYTTDSGGLFRYNNLDDAAHYEPLAKALGTRVDRMVRVNQLHTDCVIPVTAANGGQGIVRPGSEDGVDAITSATPGLVLCVVSADCVPVFLYDEESGAIGLAHSGRAGTRMEIALKTVCQMQELYGANPETTKCILGPSLCATHHQVGVDDAAQFSERFSPIEQERFIAISNGKANIDLACAIKISLARAGLREEGIHNTGICTYECPDLYSWRRDKDPDSRILSFLTLA